MAESRGRRRGDDRIARATQKTLPTDDDVATFLDRVEGEQRRSDAVALAQLMENATGEKPVVWGSILGFGRYHYRYPTGHEGFSMLAGFSPRKAAFSIYLMGVYFPDTAAEADALFAQLGKYTMGKACLYVKKLSDIDLTVLARLVALSVARLRLEYGETT